MSVIYESDYFAEHVQRNQQKRRTGPADIRKALPSRAVENHSNRNPTVKYNALQLHQIGLERQLSKPAK